VFSGGFEVFGVGIIRIPGVFGLYNRLWWICARICVFVGFEFWEFWGKFGGEFAVLVYFASFLWYFAGFRYFRDLLVFGG